MLCHEAAHPHSEKHRRIKLPPCVLLNESGQLDLCRLFGHRHQSRNAAVRGRTAPTGLRPHESRCSSNLEVFEILQAGGDEERVDKGAWGEGRPRGRRGGPKLARHREERQALRVRVGEEVCRACDSQ